MKKLHITYLGFVFVFVAASMSAGTFGMMTAQAAPFAVAGKLGAAANRLSLIEKTQFIFEEKEYCWYDHGWNGPGWYWCGYATREGFGWGGRLGWHHWDRHHPPHPVHGPGSSHNPIANNPPPSDKPVNCTMSRRRNSQLCGSIGAFPNGTPKPKPIPKKPRGLPPGTLYGPPPPGSVPKQGPPGSGPAPRPGGKT